MRNILLLVPAGLTLAACGGDARPEACFDRGAAYEALQSIVREELQFPDTARFPALGEVIVTPVNQCDFLTEGYVDSRNLAGGEVRTQYRGLLRYDEATARYEQLSMQFGAR